MTGKDKGTYNFYDSLTLISKTSGRFKIGDKDGDTVWVKPISNTGTFKLNITELVAPNGYWLIDKDKKPITLTVNYDESGVVTSITVDEEYKDFISTWTSDESGITYIKLKNTPKTIEGLKILKTDTSGSNKLENAEFQVYLNNVKSVTIKNKTYELDDIRTGTTKEDEKKLYSDKGEIYERKLDGYTFISPNRNDGDADRLYIQGLKTNSDGEIVFDEIVSTSSSKVYVTVTETDAPPGYQKLPDKVRLVLVPGDNGWELQKRTGETNTALNFNEEKLKNYVTLKESDLILNLKDDSNKITDVQLYKKDVLGSNVSGAKFRVTLTNVNSMVKGGTTTTAGTDKKITFNATSDSKGLIADISEIVPKNNTVTTIDMTITETESASGTAKLPKDLKLQFTKNSSGEWKLQAKSDNKLDTKYFTIADNVLTVTLKDDLGIDELKIIKIDTTTKEALKGAKFEITAKNVSGINSTPYTTGTDGVISLKKLTITDPAKEIKLTIKETEAAENHYLMSPNPVNITLKRIKNSNNYTISGEHAKYASCKDGVITIELKDDSKKVSGLNIKKVDKTGKYNVKDAEFQLFFNQIESIKFVGDDKTYTLAEIREKPTVSVGDGDYMSNGSVYKMRTTGGYTLISPIRDDGDADRLFIEGLKTNAAGEINSIEYVVASEENKTIYFNIKETNTSSGWAILPGTVRLLLHYDSNGHKWGTYKKTEENLKKFNQKLDKSYYNSELDDYVDINEDNLNITLKDDYKIDNFSIVKTDSQTDETIIGSKFTVTLSNIKSATGLKINSSGNTPFEDIPGNTVFKDLVIKDPNESVVITIEETKAPRGYKRMEGKIRITLTRDGSTFKINKVETIGTVLEKEFVKDNATYSNNSLTVLIKNIPIMNLGGIVWKDGQTNDKAVEDLNGKLDTEETGIAGVGVEVYTSTGTKVTKDIYGNDLKVDTAKDGDTITYKLNNGNTDTIKLNAGEYIFPNLEKGEYYIKFLYDGINYKTVKCSDSLYTYKKEEKESKVTEVGRDAFNARFKTISKGQSNDGTKLGYDYDAEKKISELQITIKGENPANDNKPDFQMTADSKKYLKSGDNWKNVWTEDGKINREHYALDINCGLMKKYLDLSFVTNVEGAKVTINGKETEYEYGENPDTTIDYNLNLYYSDYNFRINDYKTDYISNNLYSDDKNKIANECTKDDELEVYVTYSITLENQLTEIGTVEQFDYYYDKKYKEPEASSVKGNYEIIAKDSSKHKITFAHKEGTDTGETEVIYVTFKIDKNDKKYVKTGRFSNAGEITKYSTQDGGFIDWDSAPENVEIIENSDGQMTIGKYSEDDNYQAPGLNVDVDKNDRTIKGTVFEDKDKNGKNNDTSPVKDVIVQLIEIKKISGENYEYIWQETRSGSEEVKTIKRNGYDLTTYKNEGISTGDYKFTGFIPGNYIVRFIYGDGTTYDLTDNIKKYNGQDYKSTIDSKYRNDCYNDAGYENADSVARDNEARRLEVMAYSTKIDKNIGNEINNKTLEMLKNTWMCAETSIINVPGDVNSKEGLTISKDVKSTKGLNAAETYVSFESINFGLALRPNTKLVLEKHITSLKITPQGVGVQPIVEARLDIKEILDGVGDDKHNVTSDDAEGITTGLSIIKSTRDERGFWKVETDIEELAQGAKVELEYTYVIKNEGEEDYLSSAVIGEYKRGNMSSYVSWLKDEAAERKNKYKGNTHIYGDYLGQYYYTGEIGTNDVSVSSTVTKIEDNLNNNLKFVNETEPSFKKVNQEPEDKNVYDADGREATEGIETVLENIESFATLTIVGKESDDIKSTDTSKTAKLETTLAATKEGIRIPTYLEEITEYTNAAGRKDMESTPGNLSYVHSEDTRKTMRANNEEDEFWGETIIVSKPTGEDKQTPVQAIIIATTAIATIGVGIILIKKFVLKK